MATEARIHGQAAATGGGTISRNGRQIAEPVRSTTAKRRNGSPPCLTRAFQAACRTAAPSTTTNTREDKFLLRLGQPGLNRAKQNGHGQDRGRMLTPGRAVL